MFRSPKLQRQRQQLLLLGVAACVVLFALKSTNCTPQTTAVCRDHGDDGSMRQGGEHVVCIYQDRVIKTVKTCSKKKWPHQIINDHLRCATQQACVIRVRLRVRLGEVGQEVGRRGGTVPCESAALSPSCSGTWMHVAQARRRGWCEAGLAGVLG